MVEDFVSSSSTTKDNLITGAFPLVTESGTLLKGQNLTRGTLLGKITKSTTITITAGTNTGDGTCTLATLGKYAKIGSYKLTCIEKVADAGIFQLIDPEGFSIGTMTMGAFTSGAINFTLTAGTTDFEVGDSFTLAVAAGSGKVVKSLAASVDGSQVPCSILLRDIDATSEDKSAEWYLTGQFNKEKVTFGTGHSYASTKESLRDLGIYLEPVSKE